MTKKIFLIIGSILFLGASVFLISRIVKDEKNKTTGNQKRVLPGGNNEELGQAKSSDELLNIPAGKIESKSDAQKAIRDADTLMNSIDNDNPAE